MKLHTVILGSLYNQDKLVMMVDDEGREGASGEISQNSKLKDVALQYLNVL